MKITARRKNCGLLFFLLFLPGRQEKFFSLEEWGRRKSREKSRLVIKNLPCYTFKCVIFPLEDWEFYYEIFASHAQRAQSRLDFV
jgi:hypothetical protein